MAEALSQASQRKIVTVQPWVEQRDGKRFLHIPEGAGYRNLVREMPPQPVPQDRAVVPFAPLSGRRAKSE